MKTKRGRKPKLESLYKNSKRTTFYIKNDVRNKLYSFINDNRICISDFVNTAIDSHLNTIKSRKLIKPRIVSLFSGCGGMDLGFKGNFTSLDTYYEDHGFELVFANDIFQEACDTYSAHFHHTPICKDIKEYLDNNGAIPDCEVVVGGFPCQDFSLAGKREGFSTERGKLYMQMKRVIVLKKPMIFIAENVKGLTNLAGALDQIKNDFASVGYRISDHLLMAANYGVPQLRERVIIVGVRNDCVSLFHPPYPTHAADNIEEVGLLPWVTAKDAINDLWKSTSKNSVPNQNQVSKAKNYGEHLQGNKPIRADYPGPTIRAEHHGNIEFHYNKSRRLTVRECARIQSFPDNFIFKGSGSSAYVQIGNAVPPVLAWHIAKSVRNFIDEEIKARSKVNEQNNGSYSLNQYKTGETAGSFA